MSFLFTIWNQPFWHILVTDLETRLFELQLAIQIIMQNSQLHGIGRTQMGAKQLALVTLAVWKLNDNTHNRGVRLCELVAWMLLTRQFLDTTQKPGSLEVKTIQPIPSQIIVFWVASFYKPYNYGLKKEKFLSFHISKSDLFPAYQVAWP